MSSTPSIPPGSRRPSLTDELDDALGDPSIEEVPTVFLVGLSGRMAGKLFKIRPGESIIGRSSRAFVCLDEKAVSHKHARLVLNSNGCRIADLESTNGTFLNDIRLESSQPLSAGDVIRIGKNALGFLTDAEDEQQHTRAMARLTAPRLPVSVPSHTTGETYPNRMPAQLVPVSPELASISPASIAPQEEEVNALDNALDKLELAWGFLRRYWLVILVLTVLGGGVGSAFAVLRPQMSIAQFEIYLRQDYTPDPNRPQNTRDFVIRGGEFFAFAERKFTEPSLVQETLKDLRKPSNKRVASSMAGQLTFSPVDRKGTFRGTYSDADPRYAEVFLAAHLQNFLEAEINKSLTVQASEVSLMRDEYEKNEEKLDRIEQELKNFKETHLKALPENAISQLQSKGSLLTQRDTLKADVTRYSAELALAKQKLATGNQHKRTKVIKSQPYEAALATVNQQLAAARAKGFSSGHPEVIRLEKEKDRLSNLIQEIQNEKVTEAEKMANVELQQQKDLVGQLTVALNTARESLAQVEGRLGEIEALTVKMPEVEAEMTRLLRAQASAKGIHERLSFELKEKELQLQFERAGVAARYEIMQAPQTRTPSRLTSLVKFGGAGTVAGLMLGVGWGLFHLLLGYARKRKVKTSSTTSIVTY